MLSYPFQPRFQYFRRFIPLPVAILSVLLSVSCFSSSEGNEATPEVTEDWKEKFSVIEFDRLPENRGLLVEHYPSSNERRIDFFQKPISGLKGGYIGVGTDQNLTFIGWAESEYAWLMDFDPVVVAVNRIHFLFIEKSPDFATYETMWSAKNKKESGDLVLQAFAKDPALEDIRLAWKIAHRGWNDVPERLKELSFMEKQFHLRTFSNDPVIYGRIRNMIQEGRIQAIPGDLNGSTSLKKIAEAARKLNTKIRVFYTSNAEEYFNFPQAYRDNILALPVDEKSLLIRTMTSGTRQFLGYPEGEKFPETYPFHYNFQSMLTFQDWMRVKGSVRVVAMLRHTTPIEKGFSRMEKTPGDVGFQSVEQ